MTPADVSPPRLECVLGRADDMRAEVYVRLAGDIPRARITGALTGPRCCLATTLPTTIRLGHVPGAGRAAARAIVTEPSFWTPELPNLYELVAEATTATGVHAATRRLVGLRRLGVRGRSIWLDGHRWVPRGRSAACSGFDPSRYRAESLAAVITDPTPEACAAADAVGVAIVARFDDGHDTETIVERVASLSQHPAVVMVVIPSRHVATIAACRSRGTMLVAVDVDAREPPPAAVAAGVDCLVARIARDTAPMDAWRDHAPGVPIVAWREGNGEGRRACDLLQAELAAWACGDGRAPTWDWAGYIAP
ncbi:MAG: hypothetical protein WCR51_09640 [Planctomycetia bacterium]